MKNLTRRSFLKKSALGAGVLGWSARSWSQVPGANDDIRMAVVGFNGRGKLHRRLDQSGVRLTALCDVDKKVLDAEVKQLGTKGTTVEKAIKTSASCCKTRTWTRSPSPHPIIGTPWPRFGACRGLQRHLCRKAGFKATFGEGTTVKAARHKKTQVYTQSRSSYGIREAVEWVQKGNLGKIRVSRGLCYKPRASIGKTDGPQKVPATVDYDLWCGLGLEALTSAHAGASSITTGIGSGITARATWATRAFTRWTLPAGSWAKKPCRPRCFPSAGGLATRMMPKRPNNTIASRRPVCAVNHGRPAAYRKGLPESMHKYKGGRGYCRWEM